MSISSLEVKAYRYNTKYMLYVNICSKWVLKLRNEIKKVVKNA